VAAPVARGAGLESILLRSGFLGQARQSVVLSQDADPWPAFAEAGDEGGRQIRDAAFDLETLCFEIVRQNPGGFCFEKSRFGQLPNLVAQGDDLGLMLLDGGDGFLFFLDRAAENQLWNDQQTGQRGRRVAKTDVHVDLSFGQ
jgi:hypothetical protein